ncbi:MAG: amidohydrolase family protein [Actinobacteria bacterium]|nr:amidohydrolase family protein [Actinomycetota bacterium]
MADLLLQDGRLADGTAVDVRVAGGVIGEIAAGGSLRPAGEETAVELDGRLLLPAPVEPHAHLDKALSADVVANPDGDLPGAVAAWRAHRGELTVDDIFARARVAALAAVARGVTALRSHVDVYPDVELRGVEALLALREELRGVLDLQICAMSYPLAGDDGRANRQLVAEALARGADLAGGAPHIMPDPSAEMAAALELARAAGRDVDLHTDEHLRAEVTLGELATLAEGFPGSVAASHCVSLGVAPPAEQAEVAARVAAAGVAVIACPATNLYLQARGQTQAPPRGLTAVAALEEAGALLAAGGDNTEDPFNPIGGVDPLRTAALLTLAAHLDPERAYACVSERARAAMGLEPVRIEAGAPAELLAIRAGSVREALATATEDRVVVHRGRVVARTRVEGEIDSSF